MTDAAGIARDINWNAQGLVPAIAQDWQTGEVLVLAWMDRAAARWWPIFGAVYFLVATKRVHGMRLMGPTWKAAKAHASAPVSVANPTT